MAIKHNDPTVLLTSRYIHSVYPSLVEAASLMSGQQLTFYLGIDPTGPDIHLGHATNLLVLKGLIELGHKIIFLVGDFTAQTGDPTDKLASRQVLTPEEVKANMRGYLRQAEKILKPKSFQIKYNSDWLSKLTFDDLRKISRHLTIQQMISRDMFQKRLTENKPITLEEFLYPLMQGYDSVAMAVDGEVGGNDQTFNMLVGRDLARALLGKNKIVLTTKLLEDPITKNKIMNKSEGRYISLNDSPANMFGKAMALTDSMVQTVFELCTEKAGDEIQTLAALHPKDFKVALAYELVRMYHGVAAAEQARTEFENVFSRGELPSRLLEYKLNNSETTIVQFLQAAFNVSSTEAKRLIDQKAVSVNHQVVSDWRQLIKVGDVVRAGPHRFIRAG